MTIYYFENDTASLKIRKKRGYVLEFWISALFLLFDVTVTVLDFSDFEWKAQVKDLEKKDICFQIFVYFIFFFL